MRSTSPLLSYFCISYGIAPRQSEPGQKMRIEVFNPCDENDDQKTSTAILFDNDHKFLGRFAIMMKPLVTLPSSTTLKC